MSNICMYTPNVVNYNKESLEGECKIKAYTSLDQNYFNYNDFNNKAKDYPFPGVVPSGPATGSWPCRNQESCNFFDKNNPIIPEHIRRIDLLSLPPLFLLPKL